MAVGLCKPLRRRLGTLPSQRGPGILQACRIEPQSASPKQILRGLIETPLLAGFGGALEQQGFNALQALQRRHQARHPGSGLTEGGDRALPAGRQQSPSLLPLAPHLHQGERRPQFVEGLLARALTVWIDHGQHGGKPPRLGQLSLLPSCVERLAKGGHGALAARQSLRILGVSSQQGEMEIERPRQIFTDPAALGFGRHRLCLQVRLRVRPLRRLDRQRLPSGGHCRRGWLWRRLDKLGRRQRQCHGSRRYRCFGCWGRVGARREHQQQAGQGKQKNKAMERHGKPNRARATRA